MSSERTKRGRDFRELCKFVRTAVLVLTAVTVAGCVSSPSAGTEPPALLTGEALSLRPGDAIRLSFSREPVLNGEYAIDETGSAALPLLGSLLLTGRPAPEVKQDLAREYGEQTRNQAVQVVYLRRVRVLGEVRNPGLYHVDPTMTFEDALALAGGAAGDGNLKNVSLVRGGERIAAGLDVNRSVAAAIQSGDQIYVPKTSWFSRYGAVVVGASISALGAIIAFSVR